MPVLSETSDSVASGPAEGLYLIDTDPQGTLTQWHSLREAETPQRIVEKS